MLSGSADGTVRLWDADTGKERLCARAPGGDVTGVAFSADGTRLYAVTRERHLLTFSAADGTLLRRADLPFAANALAVIPGDHPGLLVAHRSGVLTRWEA